MAGAAADVAIEGAEVVGPKLAEVAPAIGSAAMSVGAKLAAEAPEIGAAVAAEAGEAGAATKTAAGRIGSVFGRKASAEAIAAEAASSEAIAAEAIAAEAAPAEAIAAEAIVADAAPKPPGLTTDQKLAAAALGLSVVEPLLPKKQKEQLKQGRKIASDAQTTHKNLAALRGVTRIGGGRGCSAVAAALVAVLLLLVIVCWAVAIRSAPHQISLLRSNLDTTRAAADLFNKRVTVGRECVREFAGGLLIGGAAAVAVIICSD